MGHQAPDRLTRAVVPLCERAILTQLKDEQVVWLARQGDPVALCRLYLHVYVPARSVMAFGRCSVQNHAVVIGSKRFADASYEMPVWREVAPGKHALQFGDYLVQRGDQLGKALGIQGRCFCGLTFEAALRLVRLIAKLTFHIQVELKMLIGHRVCAVEQHCDLGHNLANVF